MDTVFSFYDRRISNCPLLNNCDEWNHLNKGWFKKKIEAYLIKSDGIRKHKYIYIYTVSVVTALQFLYNEYLLNRR